MSHWEGVGKSDEWYTPKYVFDALGCRFDLDVANAAPDGWHVPADRFIGELGLLQTWQGFVWMNPPYGGRNGVEAWLQRFFAHGDGIALVADRTSAPWWQAAAREANAMLFVDGKIQFERLDGSKGEQPSNGTTLFAIGAKGVGGLQRAQAARLGVICLPQKGEGQ